MSATQPISWDDLRYFLVAVRAGNYTTASTQLKVNRTTVGRRIAALEERLGVSLFEQVNQSVRPTAAGRLVLQCARGMEREEESLVRRLSLPVDELSGTLRLAVATELGAEFTPEFAAFRAGHPNLKLEVRSERDPLLALYQRRVDLVLTLTRQEPDDYAGAVVAQAAQAAYCAPAYLERMPAELPFEEHEWIGWARGTTSGATTRWSRFDATMLTMAAEVDSWEAMKSAVLRGMGAGLLWCFVAEADPGLIRLRPGEPELTLPLWLLTRANVPLGAGAAAFKKYLTREIAKKVTPRPASRLRA